jgi:hypothetical protein
MLGRLFKPNLRPSTLSTPRLYNERTFYKAFEISLAQCKKEVIIESPFLTKRRVVSLLPHLQKARIRGAIVIVNTRDPIESEGYMKDEAQRSVDILLNANITILFTGKLHRKLAIIDRRILWEGSLNILSQNDSCEIMQMADSSRHAKRVIDFTGLSNFIESWPCSR